MYKPCTYCNIYGHYTHECPLLPNMHQTWVTQEATSRGKQPIAPPPPPASSQPNVLTNHFPHQGYLVVQPTQSHVAPKALPSSHNDYHILMMNSDEFNTEKVNLRTQLCQYDKPPAKSVTESQPQFSTDPLSS